MTAYSPVPTVNTGDLWTAANHNSYVRDNFAAGVPDIFTTKGDLAVATAADAAGRLGVGGDYALLAALAGETTGLAWKRGMVEIADIELAASAATMDFSSIPAGFKHLLLLVSARSDRAAQADDWMAIRYNADAGVNYDNHRVYFRATATATVSSLDGEGSGAGATICAVNAPASAFAVAEFVINDYADAGKHKTIIGENRVRRQTGGGMQLEMSGCTWKSTAAINQITLGLWSNGTNFIAGTRATLYGIG